MIYNIIVIFLIVLYLLSDDLVQFITQNTAASARGATIHPPTWRGESTLHTFSHSAILTASPWGYSKGGDTRGSHTHTRTHTHTQTHYWRGVRTCVGFDDNHLISCRSLMLIISNYHADILTHYTVKLRALLYSINLLARWERRQKRGGHKTLSTIYWIAAGARLGINVMIFFLFLMWLVYGPFGDTVQWGIQADRGM